MNPNSGPKRQLLPFAMVRDDLPIRREFFRQLPLLAGVEAKFCDAIADTAIHYERPKNSLLIIQDETPRETSIVIRGLVQISRDLDGIVYHMPYRGAGMPIGMNNLFSSDPVLYTMQTVMPSDLFSLDRTVCREVFDTSKVFSRNIIRTAVDHAIFVSDTLQQVIRLTHKAGRLPGELLQIVDALKIQYVSPAIQAADPLEIDWLQRDQLAQKIGCSKAVVSTALQTLKENNLVVVNETTGNITITPRQIEKLRCVYEALHNPQWLGFFPSEKPQAGEKADKTLGGAIAYMVARKWKPE